MSKFTFIRAQTESGRSTKWGDNFREQQVKITCNCTKRAFSETKSANDSYTKQNTMKTFCMTKQFPKAILVGMTKGGTTALMDFLKAHPLLSPRYIRPDTRYFNHYYEKPYDWYRNLMPCSYHNQITISKSTEYFFTPGIAEKIRKFDPSMKILIMVREPIDRAMSQYVMWKHQAKFRIGNASFEEAVTTGRNKEIDKDSRLIIVSNYQRHMKAWIDNFSLKQILIIDGLNFVKNPADELNKLEDFLGVDRYFTPDSFVL
ncbi:heparan sulfate glucosamine 3-O-sulfotransferase 3B1-like [Mercenaria mercenaria]|uniref:heparan sulfate glucosamine 3-O-sulfotransferase 3B1-like n=1 Tax=Mercenaria mercenaria TaxID=6596 RepID=UPI00234F6D0C|nr:heparan sulfate glucosamine 3-O-sulfotransferase 3B1-like [Mercenaria mercenaria]